MRNLGIVAAVMACAMAAPAIGATTSITGGGGSIPASGSGGGGSWNNGDATAMPRDPFRSSVTISGGVTSVQSITFTGLVHTFIGDLHAVLYDPNGTGHNLFVRPGVGFNNSIFGSSMHFDGSYTFFESGAPNDLPTTTGGGPHVVPGGEYNQTFQGSATAMGSWENGAQGIFNTPLSQISGAAGEWTLRIYDWTGGDVGTLGSWTMTYVLALPSPGAAALLALAAIAARRRRRD